MDNFDIAVEAIVDIIGDEFGQYPYQQMKKDVREAVLDAIGKVRAEYIEIEAIRSANIKIDFIADLAKARDIYYANKEREAKDRENNLKILLETKGD